LGATALPARELDTTISQTAVLPGSSSLRKTVFHRPEHGWHIVRRQHQRLAAELEYRMAHRPRFTITREMTANGAVAVDIF
jgi:hypothetical protein